MPIAALGPIHEAALKVVGVSGPGRRKGRYFYCWGRRHTQTQENAVCGGQDVGRKGVQGLDKLQSRGKERGDRRG